MDKAFSNPTASTEFMLGDQASSSKQFAKVKKEEPKDDFTFDEPAQKKQKTTSAPQGRPVKLKPGNSLGDDLQMNWNLIQVGLCITVGKSQGCILLLFILIIYSML